MRNPTTPEEIRYNEAHGRTRRVVKRIFGLLKARFRCLDKSCGALLYSPVKMCSITVTCCMLHNVAVRKNIPLPADDGDQAYPPEGYHDVPNEDGSSDDETADDLRQELISCYFT